MQSTLQKPMLLRSLFVTLFLKITALTMCIGAQTKPLMPSISYDRGLFNSTQGNNFTVDSEGIYPDLANAKLFYVEINEEETAYNTGALGAKYTKINRKLISRMSKSYPYEFKVFSHFDRYKGQEYFIKEGFRYRMLILSHWYTVIGQNYQEQWKQNFCVAVQDLETGKIYSSDKWYWHHNYVEKFIRDVRN